MRHDPVQDCGSPSVMVVQSKMRNLHEAKRKWAVNHSDASPFPVHKLSNFPGAASASGSINSGHSPFTPSRGYAMVTDKNAKQPSQFFNWQNVGQQPANNNLSSFGNNPVKASSIPNKDVVSPSKKLAPQENGEKKKRPLKINT